MANAQMPLLAVRARDRAAEALEDAAASLRENKFSEAGSLIAEALREIDRVDSLLASATDEMRQRNEQFRRDFPHIFGNAPDED